MIKIVLPAPKIISNNLFWSGVHRRTRQKIAEEQHLLVLLCVMDQIGLVEPLPNPPYHVTYNVYPAHRRMDIGNTCVKGILDGIVLAGLLLDDNLHYVQAETVIFRGVDKLNPRIEVVLEEMEAK